MFKKISIFILISSFLIACSSNNNININEGNINDNGMNSNNTSNNETSNNNEAEDSSNFDELIDNLNFDEFELEVEYDDGKEYEAEFEKNSDGQYEFEIEDEVNDIYLEGQEAFENMYPRLESLDLTSNTDKEDIIQQTLEAFGLEDNYEEYEVEIEFKDGKEVEYEDKK